jgi:lipoate-protein ligase B
MFCRVEQLGLVDYQDALRLQAEKVAQRKAGTLPDTLLLLEHPHVFTLGRNAKHEHVLASHEWLEAHRIEVFETDRGGDITYHGPGQLVGYPILDLTAHRRDLIWYMRSLEEVLIGVAADLGVRAGRLAGAPGVWVENEKLAAMGVHVSRWVTSHGFALNVNTDLGHFEKIVPCGLRGKGVTSLAKLLGKTVRMETVRGLVVEHFARVFGLRVEQIRSPELKIESSPDRSPGSISSLNSELLTVAHMNPRLTRTKLHEIYYHLHLNRRLDEQLTVLYRQGKVVGGVYSGLGQEAISVGSAHALEPQDVVGPMIRNIGTLLVRGYRPRDLFMQYMGKKGGPTGGRDGNTHFGDMTRGVVAPISMLGELVPVLAGVALAAKIRKEKRVALTYVGDGATSTGPFHEGLNFAAVLKLPLLIIVENNGWAYSTPVERQTANPDYAGRAKGYGIPGIAVDGNDVLAVYQATRTSADRARRGGGPTLIECRTMRMKGHAEHDDARYVPKKVLENWRRKDPLLRFDKYLRAKKLITATEAAEIQARIEKEIREDTAFAESSPLPASEDTLGAVWADSLLPASRREDD